MNTCVKISSLAAALLVLAGCTGDTLEDPPDGALRFLHAAPTLGTVDFLLVTRPQGRAGYAVGTDSFALDEDTYTINVETDSPTSTTVLTRFISEQRSITAGQESLLVLYDDGPSPALTEYLLPLNPLEEGNTEVTALHAAKGAPAVDIYLEADGADLAAATPRATLAFKEISGALSIPAASYRITATTPGDPLDVLYQSPVFTSNEQTSVLVAVLAGAGTTASALRASIYDRTAATPIALNDISGSASHRFVNGAVTVGAVDLVVDGDFAMPTHAAVAPREVRDYVDVSTDEVQIQVTPAGNPGVIEFEQTTTLSAGNLQTQVIAGTTGAVTARTYVEDNRGIAPRVRFRVRSLAATFETIDVYITEPGGTIDEPVAGFVGLPVTGVEFVSTVLGDDYDIILIENDGDPDTEDTTVIAGPIAVTWDTARVYEVLIFDSDTPGTVDVSIADVTAPQP